MQGLRGVLLSQEGRLDFVDALRGLALLGVMVVHTGQHVAGLPPRAAAITNAGSYGVQLFFVASAFTLFYSLHQRSRSEARPMLNYFLRRLFRIAPLFWLAVPFYVKWYGTGPQYWAPHGLGWRDVLATAAFVHGWHPTMINSVVPGGWSIAVEMNFYLLVPLLFARLTNLRRCLWFFIGCAAAQGVLNAAMRPVFVRLLAADEQHLVDLMHALWLPTQMPVFAAGFALYYVLAPRLGRGRGDAALAAPPDRPPSPVLLIAVAATVLALLWQSPPVAFVGSLLAILAAALAVRPISLLVNGWTRYLGNISYSGYLVHFAVLDIAERVIRHFTALPRYPLTYLPVLFAATLFGTVVVATMTNRLIEEPARALGRSLIARLERQR